MFHTVTSEQYFSNIVNSVHDFFIFSKSCVQLFNIANSVHCSELTFEKLPRLRGACSWWIHVKRAYMWIHVKRVDTSGYISKVSCLQSLFVSKVVMGWLRSVGSIKSYVSLQNIVSFIGLFCKRDL